MFRTTIMLDEKLHQLLKRQCSKEKKSFKQVVTDLLNKGLKFNQEIEKKENLFSKWNTSKIPLSAEMDVTDRSVFYSHIDRTLP